jgi:hypothetical protein
MGIRAALHHKTVYEYDRLVTLASHSGYELLTAGQR